MVMVMVMVMVVVMVMVRKMGTMMETKKYLPDLK